MLVKKDKKLSDMVKEYEVLLGKIQSKMDDIGAIVQINNTRLAKGLYELKKYMSSSSGYSDSEILSIFGYVNKILFLNELFEDENISFDFNELRKVLTEKKGVEELNQEYNNTYFELSMAIRAAKLSGKKSLIEMKTICDVIIDNDMAIECKYLHSMKKVRENIKDAFAQINQRVESGMASRGFAALDVTFLCSTNRIKKFADDTMNYYIHNMNNIRMSVEDKFDLIIENKNFIKTVMAYAGNEAAVIIADKLDFLRKDKPSLFDRHSDYLKGVTCQYFNSIFIEHGEYYKPVQLRVMEPIINPKLSEEDNNAFIDYIKPFSTGF